MSRFIISSLGGYCPQPREREEEIAETESVTVHCTLGHRLEQRDLFRLQKVRAPDEDTARAVEQSCFARRHGSGQQLVAELLHVARWMHIQNHEIARDSLEPPVVVRPEKLSHARHSDRAVDGRQ